MNNRQRKIFRITTPRQIGLYKLVSQSYTQQIQLQRQTIYFLKKELYDKQNIIEKLLDTVTGCLYSQPVFSDVRFFTLQKQNIKKIQCNSDISVMTINKNQEAVCNIIDATKYNKKMK